MTHRSEAAKRKKRACVACEEDLHEDCENPTPVDFEQNSPEYRLLQAIFGKQVIDCCCVNLPPGNRVPDEALWPQDRQKKPDPFLKKPSP